MHICTMSKCRVHGIGALVAVVALGVTVPAWGAIYTDIQGDPAQRAIERLAAKGVIRGTPNGKFNPTGPVTRVELAVFLARALGLSGQGSLPEFTDAGEISKDAQPAVIAMLSLATVSPQKVELKKGVLVYSLTADKGVYGSGDEVVLRFTVENTSQESVKFEYANTQFFDFIIRDPEGSHEIARWSIGRSFRALSEPFTLAAGKTFEFLTKWKQVDQNDAPVPAGRYELMAVQTTKANPTVLSIIFNKGLMLGYPDRTFRPKQAVTRAEAAALVVRALGLGEPPLSGPLTVTDAADIPAPLRGAVAAAIEQKIMLPSAQRAFQPARPVTRAELAWALDVLMDTAKRYDFSKGVLKDLHVGNPTLIAVEDDRKALRTFRLARANAVYRNGKLVDLKDLKPGDTVLFLKIGDVGDVAYIEATGR